MENRRLLWCVAGGLIVLCAIALLPAMVAAPLSLLVFGMAFWRQRPVDPEGATGQLNQPVAPSSEHNSMLDVHALADALPDGLFFLDGNSDIVFLNKMAGEIFSGVNAGQNFITRFRAPELVNAARRCLQMRQTVKVDYLDKKNNERFFIVLFVPLDGNHTLCIFRDRTETRMLERMRSDFIANASHELRTPLTSLRGFIETIRGPAKDDAAARDKFLSIMQEQAERMSRLIDDLLSLSRLEMKSGLDGAEPVDIRGVLKHVVETLSPLSQQLGVQLTLDLPKLPVQVFGRRDDLIQLFQNLIENACKYGQTGGKVEIGANVDAAQVAVMVRDFGPGIAEEHIPRLTERFYRVNAEASRSHKGTGLGLAIVKHILTHHSGRLTIQSKPGKGARFTVALPIINA